MQITGKLIHKFPEQTFDTANGPFTKRPIVIKTDGQYPQEVKVDVTGKALEHVPEVGTIVTADIDIRGREYKRKDTGERDWFTSINCWKLTTGEPQTATAEGAIEDVPF